MCGFVGYVHIYEHGGVAEDGKVCLSRGGLFRRGKLVVCTLDLK